MSVPGTGLKLEEAEQIVRECLGAFGLVVTSLGKVPAPKGGQVIPHSGVSWCLEIGEANGIPVEWDHYSRWLVPKLKSLQFLPVGPLRHCIDGISVIEDGRYRFHVTTVSAGPFVKIQELV